MIEPTHRFPTILPLRSTIDFVRIRPAIDKSLEEIEEIQYLAFAGSPYRFTSGEEIRELISAGMVCLVARLETGYRDDVLGMVLFDTQQRSRTLHAIAVHPSSQFRGIGRKLLRFVTGYGKLPVGCLVDESDSSTGLFLEKCGFDLIGHRLTSSGTLAKWEFSP